MFLLEELALSLFVNINNPAKYPRKSFKEDAFGCTVAQKIAPMFAVL
jgi:hypothetical protein